MSAYIKTGLMYYHIPVCRESSQMIKQLKQMRDEQDDLLYIAKMNKTDIIIK